MSDDDIRHMRTAIGLARRALGTARPNPAVGCVVVRDGVVAGRGWTQPGGRPHAETEALRRAGAAATGATAYVSLEPCAHHGETPPCAEALIAAGINRAVIAIPDPDPRVDGGGIALLREAGVAVETGVCAPEAIELAAGFIKRVTVGLPMVTLKLATTLDGRIATRTGASQWITGEIARDLAHGLRASHDAVLVGAGTAVTDDPALTCRLPGLGDRSPVRVVLDGREALPATHNLVAGARETPTWVLVPPPRLVDRRAQYSRHGLELIEVAADESGDVDITQCLHALAERGITRVLVEGGGRVAASLLGRGLVDRIVWFRAPRLIGGDGFPAAGPFGVESLDDAPNFIRIATRAAGGDMMEVYAVDTGAAGSA